MLEGVSRVLSRVFVLDGDSGVLNGDSGVLNGDSGVLKDVRHGAKGC